MSDRAIAVTPDKKYIIAGGGDYRDHPGYVKIWDFKTGELVRTDPWKHYVLDDIVALPDCSSIIVHGRDDHHILDGTTYVYVGNVDEGKYQLMHKWVYHETDLAFIHYSKNRIGFDRHIFDLQTKSLSRITLDEEKHVRQLYSKIEITSDRRLLSNDETFIVEDEAGRVVKTFAPGHGNRFHKYSPKIITPDRRYLLAEKWHDDGRQLSEDRTLGMWDVQSGNLAASFETCRGSIKAIDITSDSQYAVVYGIDPHYIVRVINLHTGDLTLEIIPEP